MCIDNKNKIGVLRQVNGLLELQKVKIDQEDVLISKLKAMRKNPNKTIFDMQNLLEEYYPQKTHKGMEYDYLYPRGYSETFVNYA